MRHRKDTFKIGRTSSHREAMVSNMLKSLIEYERIETTLRKAKELKRYIDKVITLVIKGDLASIRSLKSLLRIKFNPKKENLDSKVFKKLNILKERFEKREKKCGYSRIIKKGFRKGDSALTCFIELVE
ncbi:MAG: hypothetical protein AMS24_01295 [Chlamydiae bacterium SM23_39]|nr:MAG: hypothetical protein AMS24_01295 [Chlamydiae bacterium SM23_39]